MTVVRSRLVELLSRLLDRDERIAVLGDLAKAGASEAQAIRQLAGLIVRRYATDWKTPGPWIALLGAAMPIGIILSFVSRPWSDDIVDGVRLYAITWIPGYLDFPGARHDVFALAAQTLEQRDRAVDRQPARRSRGDRQEAPPVILVDTGPLVALFDPKDEQHERCVERLKQIREPLRTTVPVLTEAFYMLQPHSIGSDRLRDFTAHGGVAVSFLDHQLLTRAFELMERYSDRPMDLADASLVACAEALETRRVFVSFA
jgi:predicted nucleic acid-binding protein